jgi:hypothetical protein
MSLAMSIGTMSMRFDHPNGAVIRTYGTYDVRTGTQYPARGTSRTYTAYGPVSGRIKPTLAQRRLGTAIWIILGQKLSVGVPDE